MSGSEPPRQALVSIHDVMPETMPRCQDLVRKLQQRDIAPVTLLVVPGRAWSQTQLQCLRQWQDQGLILAGHGWTHATESRATLYHKLHGLLLSRMAAEHLSQSREQLLALVQRCYDWFAEQGLQPPSFYVPPAWALGQLSHTDLQRLPFSHYEVLTGVIDARRGELRRLDLVGYEADTALRAAFLRPWNAFNARRAWRAGRALRVGIHPHDPELRLADQLWQQLESCQRFLHYGEVFADS